MIVLKRERNRTAIPRSLRGGYLRKKLTKLFEDERRFQRNEIEKVEFKSAYWKKAKNQLVHESSEKCAYCEADTRVVAHGDVEHYRPKSVYWWLAYCYDNYLFSCQICNQTYKSNHFPTSGNIVQNPSINMNTTDQEIELLTLQFCPEPLDDNHSYTIQDLKADHLSEDPHLINPYYSDPSDFFHWVASDSREEVEVISNPNSDSKYTSGAISFYGLNRDELKRLRYREYSKFKTFKSVSTTPGLPTHLQNEVSNMINRMISDSAPFSGMLKYFNTIL